jgi:hypothetical protein
MAWSKGVYFRFLFPCSVPGSGDGTSGEGGGDGGGTPTLNFNTSTIDSNTILGLYTSIAIDSQDKVHISYLDRNWNNSDLKYTVSD